MNKGAAPDLAYIDAALARARELTRRKLTSRRFRRIVKGKERFNPPAKMSRAAAFERMRDARIELVHRRNQQADTPISAPWDPTLQPRLDELYDIAEKQAAPEAVRARVRACTADKLGRAGAWARENGVPEPEQFEVMAAKLRQARRVAWWGQHLDTGAVVMRFVDRSGLALLDPSEARERQAVLIERLVPTVARLVAAGLRVYYAVFSEPNVEAGSLAFGKRHLFDRFRRVVLSGAVPEIVGAFAVQEDPLAADGHSWNVHLNVLLVVDPTLCTPLPPDLVEQGELALSGALAKLPARPLRDRTPPGCLSYAKIHYLWGSHQAELAHVRGDSSAALIRSIKEVVKYACKWVGQKQLDAMAEDPRAAVAPAADLARSSGDRGADCGAQFPAPALVLVGERPTARQRRLAAPAFVDWPEARVVEWIRANQRFRRVRGWGRLYRIAKHQRAPDPDQAGRIRWLGRVFIEPRGVIVHAHFARFIDSIHGDKSGRGFGGSTGRSFDAQARAGPATGQVHA